MRRLLTRFFTCMIVCVGLFISHTHDALARQPDGGSIGYLNYSCGRGTGAAPTCVECSSGCTVLANICTPPSGETFIGWKKNMTGTIYQPGDTINASGGEPIGGCDGELFSFGWALTAQYEPAGATYTVTYSCNGGTGTAPSNETATENQSFTPASNTCTKNGYAFTGWAVSGTNDIKQAGTAFTWNYDADKTFSAQWTPTYTVTYSCNGGTGTAPSSATVASGTSFTPAANTCTAPSGYSGFSGWAVSGTNDVKPAGTAFTWNYNENKTFTAQWTGNTVPITWYNGDTQLTVPSNAQSCEYGGTLTLPSIPTPPEPGLVFDGWTIRQLSCTGITDSTTCNNTEGCIWAWDGDRMAYACKNYVSYCSTITDEETCRNSADWGGASCGWSYWSSECFNPGGSVN